MSIIQFLILINSWYILLSEAKFELRIEKKLPNYKYNNWSCISTGIDAIDSSMSFLPTDLIDFESNIVKGKISGYMSRIATSGGKFSAKNILPPVLDIRWRDFKINNNNNEKALFDWKFENIKLLHVSLLFKDAPRININNVSLQITTKTGQSEIIWRHYTIYKIKYAYKIEENLVNYTQSFKNFNLRKLTWTNADVLWKIHDYQYWHVNPMLPSIKTFMYNADNSQKYQTNHNLTLFTYCENQCKIMVTLRNQTDIVSNQSFSYGNDKRWKKMIILSDLSNLLNNSWYEVVVNTVSKGNVFIDSEFKIISKKDKRVLSIKTSKIVDCQLITHGKKIFGENAIKIINTTIINCPVVVCDNKNDCACESAVITVPTTTTIPPTKKLGSTFSISILIVSICLLLVVICLFGVFFIYYKYKKKRNNQYINANVNESQILLSILPVKLTQQNIKEFLSDNRSKDEIAKEYEEVPRVFNFASDVGELECNIMKNRYRTILPYDNCRVKLINDGYINASYVQGFNGPTTYIATQCPMYNCVNDFWQMIWQENTNIIVCLASGSEGEKRFVNYWPGNNLSQDYNNINVKNGTIELYTDFLIRTLFIRDTKTSIRKIRLFQYISWPDHSVPLFPLSLLGFFKSIIKTETIGPIVVHCSAGIGRTGTYIMCDNFLRNNSVLDIKGYLKQIRQNRTNLVSKISQYRLVYFIIDEYINGLHHCITLDEFINLADHDNHNSDVGNVIDLAKKVFESISERSYSDDIITLMNLKEDNATKVELHSLNPVYVNGYEKSNNFITIKYPSPNKFNKFWSLIDLNQISTVVCLMPDGMEIINCWPTNGNSLPVTKYLMVNLTKTINEDAYNIYTVNVANSSTGVQLKTVIYYYKEWNLETKLPKDFCSFHNFLTIVKIFEKVTLFCCIDGSEGCGLLLAYDLINQKLYHDKTFDILWAIRGIKPFNRNFISSLGQIIFLYKLVKHNICSKSNEDYKNIIDDSYYVNI